MKVKKSLLIAVVFTCLMAISLTSALNIQVEKIEKEPTIISELNNPAVFDFRINNSGDAEMVEIYSLVGVTFDPKGTFNLHVGETTREVKAYPDEAARSKEGMYKFEYQIKGVGEDLFKDKLAIKIIKLENVIEMTPNNIRYGAEETVVNLRNTQNLEIEDMTVKIKSIFFEKEVELSFKPFESKNITLDVKTGEVKDLDAGHYVVTIDVKLEDASAKVEGAVDYVERENIISEKAYSGLIVRTTKMTNTNNGNLDVPDKMEITKNILTRLFTTSTLEPLSTERRGVLVNYRWEKDLKPAESWTVEVKTNYTLPFILILLIIASAAFVYFYTKTAVVLNKRCSFVRTSGGQFALKIMLNVKARKGVDNLQIFDKIPMAMKLYEKAGMPHKFDSQTGKLSWKVDRLNAGEERIFSYIIYSPIRVVGRLELAPAIVHFNNEGKTQYVHSNRTFFMSEIHPRM